MNSRAMAAQQMLGSPIQRAGAPEPARNHLGELLVGAGKIGLGALGGQYGSGAADYLSSKLFKPRNPAMIAAAQHPKYSLAADRAWSMAGGGE